MPRLRMMLLCEKYDDGKPVQLLSRIGLRVGTMGHEKLARLSLQANNRLYVDCIDPGKSAVLCGIRANDVIEKINGFEICSWIDVEKALYMQTSDKPIQFLVRRLDSTIGLTYLASWPD